LRCCVFVQLCFTDADLLCACTVLVIAHRLSTVRNAHTVSVVQSGCVVQQGTHDTLMSVKGQYRKLGAPQPRCSPVAALSAMLPRVCLVRATSHIVLPERSEATAKIVEVWCKDS
jgi:ABC-type microcin C transport system duplicated ATPase subunit YejF